MLNLRKLQTNVNDLHKAFFELQSQKQNLKIEKNNLSGNNKIQRKKILSIIHTNKNVIFIII